MSTRPTPEQVAEAIHAVRLARAINACDGDAGALSLLSGMQDLSKCSNGFRADLLEEARAVLALFPVAAAPTPNQATEARDELTEFLSHLARFPDSKRAAKLAPALQALLAATEPPTDEELMAEAASYCVAQGTNHITVFEARLYAAGARREGRRV